MDWKPIATAPKDGTVIFLCGGHDDCLEYVDEEEGIRLMVAPCRAQWCGGEWLIALAEFGYQRAIRVNPTHWLPLDALPHPPSSS